MTFLDAIKSGFSNYVNPNGRAARSEFWFWTLFCLLLSSAAGILDGAMFSENETYPISSLMSLATFLPSIMVAIRRLHDVDRTGWWILIAFTIIGFVVLIYWYCVKGTSGPNRFGPDPLQGEVAVTV